MEALEIAVCNVTAVTKQMTTTTSNPLVVGDGSTEEHHESDYDQLFISDLVPASVSVVIDR